MLVDDLVNAFNDHTKAVFSPSEYIYVGESIYRWNGHGGDRIEKSIPHYVHRERNLESGCELQNAACGKFEITMRLEIVK